MLGYLGTVFVLWGAKLVGDRKGSGWLAFVAGDLLWIAHGAARSDSAVVVCEALFLILHVRGWRRWRKTS